MVWYGELCQHLPHRLRSQKLLTHVYLGFFLHVLSLFCLASECVVFTFLAAQTQMNISSSFSHSQKNFIISPNHPEKVVQSRQNSNEKKIGWKKSRFSQNPSERLNRITHRRWRTKKEKNEKLRGKNNRNLSSFFSLKLRKKEKTKQWKSAVLNSCGMCLVVYVYAATSDGVTSNSSIGVDGGGGGGGRGDGSSQLELSNDSNRLKCLPAIRRTNVINLLCLTASALWSIHLIFIIMFDLFHMFFFSPLSYFMACFCRSLMCLSELRIFSQLSLNAARAFLGFTLQKDMQFGLDLLY